MSEDVMTPSSSGNAGSLGDVGGESGTAGCAVGRHSTQSAQAWLWTKFSRNEQPVAYWCLHRELGHGYGWPFRALAGGPARIDDLRLDDMMNVMRNNQNEVLKNG